MSMSEFVRRQDVFMTTKGRYIKLERERGFSQIVNKAKFPFSFNILLLV